jgi:hypothetical protein
MFGDFQYTTMRKEMPLQNALFLLIPVSYVAGWTLLSLIVQRLLIKARNGELDLEKNQRRDGAVFPYEETSP